MSFWKMAFGSSRKQSVLILTGKNLLADMKRKEYVYNRVEKAYFLVDHEISPYSFMHAVTIKGFKI